LSELPHVRRNALDLAEKGIPGVSMVKSGDLKYHFKSDQGIYYEPWNPLSSGGGKRDSLTKIMEDHYLIQSTKPSLMLIILMKSPH